MKDYPGLKDKIGLEIANLEHILQISSSEMSRRTRVTRQYLGKLKNGGTNMTINVLFFIAEGVGMKPSEIIKLVETGIFPRQDQTNTPGRQL